jgi:adenylate cyclase class IV
MGSKYEIEVKTLLGSKENADSLKEKIKAGGGTSIGQGKQLNHYFLLEDSESLKSKLSSYFVGETLSTFNKILTEGKNLSVRTRETSAPDTTTKKVLFVLKASLDDNSSSNGVSRMEFEQGVDMSLDELDNILLAAGLKYQSKWSREREEYKLNDVAVCIDKNAGYGYLAEFEKITEDSAEIPNITQYLLNTMSGFNVLELPQDRLERMFAYYNQNWQDYYGTDKVFIVE